jgi:hypothetical protein
MVDHTSQRSLPAGLPAGPARANLSNARVRSSSFKYYIHDGSGALRLKLVGELTRTEIDELNGCWRTAKTTLAGRKLVLDLRSLQAVDECGKDWLEGMREQGASYVPEDYLATCVPGQHATRPDAEAASSKISLFSKLASFFRGARASASESWTKPAP